MYTYNSIFKPGNSLLNWRKMLWRKRNASRYHNVHLRFICYLPSVAMGESCLKQQYIPLNFQNPLADVAIVFKSSLIVENILIGLWPEIKRLLSCFSPLFMLWEYNATLWQYFIVSKNYEATFVWSIRSTFRPY